MVGKKAAQECPRCGNQMLTTAWGVVCEMCGYANYGDRRNGARISQRDIEENKNGQKRDIL